MRSASTFRGMKNGETRTVPLSRSVLECLEQERKRRIILSPYVFHCVEIRTAWENVIEKAGLQGLRFHDLRHTVASHLAMNGASTLEIAAILGHKTLAMVKRYSHLSVSATAFALNRMNEEILGALKHAS